MKIKKIKYLFSLSLVLVFFMNCSEDDNDLGFVDNVVAPTEVSAIFNITQDNSGLVSITPNSTGAVSYEIGFGDGSNEMATLETGESITHTYEEGTYAVAIKAIGITGLETEASQNLVVSFRAPENLVINTEIDSANPFQVNVSATADYAASFLVYFDTSNPDEVGTPLALEEVLLQMHWGHSAHLETMQPYSHHITRKAVQLLNGKTISGLVVLKVDQNSKCSRQVTVFEANSIFQYLLRVCC